MERGGARGILGFPAEHPPTQKLSAVLLYGCPLPQEDPEVRASGENNRNLETLQPQPATTSPRRPFWTLQGHEGWLLLWPSPTPNMDLVHFPYKVSSRH